MPYTDFTEGVEHHYVPSLVCLCLRQLASYPDQISEVALTYIPQSDSTQFDILKALIPSYHDNSFSISAVDPRLWVTLAQIYGASLPEIFYTYPIALVDTHLAILQCIPSTTTFSLITILELPGCPQLTDDTLTTIKSLHNLTAFDASETEISSWGLKKLIMPASALLTIETGDTESMSKAGPLGLRILRLRNCKAVDHTVFGPLQKLLLLSVIDLRGTACDPSSIPLPYDRWSAADLQQPRLLSLYHPVPLAESVSSLKNMSASLHSSTTIFQIHIDSVNRRPATQRTPRLKFKKQRRPSTKMATQIVGDVGSRTGYTPRSTLDVEIQDQAFTFTPSAILSHPPQNADIDQSEHRKRIPSYMLSVAEQESRELASRQSIRNFYAPVGRLADIVPRQMYSAEKHYAEFARREDRSKSLFFSRATRRDTIWPNFDGSDRPKKKSKLANREAIIPSPSATSLLMLYRAPPPWRDIESPEIRPFQSDRTSSACSRLVNVPKVATVNKSRVRMQMLADLKAGINTAARNRRAWDTMASFDGVKSTHAECSKPGINKEVRESIRPILLGKNPFRRSNTVAAVNTTVHEAPDNRLANTKSASASSSNQKEGTKYSEIVSMATTATTAQSKQEPQTSHKRPLKPISSVRIPPLPPEEIQKLKESMVKKPRASLPSSSFAAGGSSNSMRRKSLPAGRDGDIKKLMRQLVDAPVSRKRSAR